MSNFGRFLEKTKRKAKFDILTIKMFKKAFVADTKDRIKTGRILRQCPDEESRQRKAAEIQEAKQREYDKCMRIQNMLFNLSMASFELVAAIEDRYSYPENPNVTEKAYEAAPENFQKAKDKMMMYARWLLRDGDKSMEEYINALEPVTIDTYATVDGWGKLFNDLKKTQM